MHQSAKSIKERVFSLFPGKGTYASTILLGGDKCATSHAVRWAVKDPSVVGQKEIPQDNGRRKTRKKCHRKSRSDSEEVRQKVWRQDDEAEKEGERGDGRLQKAVRQFNADSELSRLRGLCILHLQFCLRSHVLCRLDLIILYFYGLNQVHTWLTNYDSKRSSASFTALPGAFPPIHQRNT